MRFVIPCAVATFALLGPIMFAVGLYLQGAGQIQLRYNLIKQDEREAMELLRRSIEREGLHVDADGK